MIFGDFLLTLHLQSRCHNDGHENQIRVTIMAITTNITSFDDITEDGRLWAVHYEGDEDNVLG